MKVYIFNKKENREYRNLSKLMLRVVNVEVTFKILLASDKRFQE